MYKIEKLTVKNRCEIPVGGVVEIEVNEEVYIHSDLGKQCYGQFYLRKCLAKKGLLQCVHSPFPANWRGKPLIVVKNDDVAPIELRADDEIGCLWIFTHTSNNQRLTFPVSREWAKYFLLQPLLS